MIVMYRLRRRSSRTLPSDALTLFGGWLGLEDEEGRGKLRYAPGRSMHPLIRGSLNATSYAEPFGVSLVPVWENEPLGKETSEYQEEKKSIEIP